MSTVTVLPVTLPLYHYSNKCPSHTLKLINAQNCCTPEIYNWSCPTVATSFHASRSFVISAPPYLFFSCSELCNFFLIALSSLNVSALSFPQQSPIRISPMTSPSSCSLATHYPTLVLCVCLCVVTSMMPQAPSPARCSQCCPAVSWVLSNIFLSFLPTLMKALLPLSVSQQTLVATISFN